MYVVKSPAHKELLFY